MMHPQMHPQMNPLDNIKAMILPMVMLKGTTNQQDPINLFFIMLIVSFIDTIVLQIKNVFNILSRNANIYITKKSKDLRFSNLSLFDSKPKKSSIIIKIENASKNPTSDAIIDLIINLPNTKCILLKNGSYSINYSEDIEISKGIYAKLVNTERFTEYTTNTNTNNTNTNNTNTNFENINTNINTNNTNANANTNANTNHELTNEIPYAYIDIYSHTINMELLRHEINIILKNYLIKMTNKLGNNIYYFSELPLTVYRDSNGKIDSSKQFDTLHFTMKPFVTNRSFNNLFGKNVDIIHKRVDFFKHNKDWYDAKGVPYTLGIMVSGIPGSGKTSLIKCIANEMKRHIINIHLNDTMTKSQIEHLFYNEQINVTQNGKTEIYTIPIDKRIYVLEDVDCQCEMILDRGNLSLEQVLINKNIELKAEIEKLKYALSEISLGKKVVVQNDNNPVKQPDKNEDKNQKITLSFLLNLFDGVLETPGRITFMTTNYLDKLDKAFTRPGRIDIISNFGYANSEQIIKIIQHRYDTTLTEQQIEYIQQLDEIISPAELSRILFENFDNLEGALQGLETYINETKMNDIKINEVKQNIQNKLEKLDLGEEFKNETLE